jgi:uncharacterized membrane protein
MSTKMLAAAISAVLALGISEVSMAANNQRPTLGGTENCYGIVKAGQNDCGTATHGCSGAAKQDGMRDEWISMPTGLCNKIVGGTTEPPSS